MSDSSGWGDEATPSQTPQAQRLSKLCVASLVLGILTPLCCGILTGIPGVICGHMGLSAVGDEKGELRGRGLGIAGLVLSYIGIAINVVSLMFFDMSEFEEMLREMQNQ